MRPVFLLSTVAVLAALSIGQTAPSPPPISPAVTDALKGLSADDYAARQKAMADVQLALGQQLRAMIPPDDPEAQLRFLELLSFEQGLCAWAKDVFKLPGE
jgi:hypothetical protein